jgi:hypothetical protein
MAGGKKWGVYSCNCRICSSYVTFLHFQEFFLWLPTNYVRVIEINEIKQPQSFSICEMLRILTLWHRNFLLNVSTLCI